MRIKISKAEDMQTVAVILFKNGYTVHMEREKVGSKYETYLVYEKPGLKE